MKRILLMLFVAGASMTALAQNTRELKGTVIDKTGNPLSGAKIEATGGAETTTTDADGSFNLEVSRYLKSITATYPGLISKTLKLDASNDLLIELKKKEHKCKWFINAMTAHSLSLNRAYYIGEGGLMFGQYIGDKWGWFAKGLIGKAPADESYCIWGSTTVGGIRHIKKSWYGYVGFGFGTGCEYYYSWGSTYNSLTTPSYIYYNNEDFYNTAGIAIDWGLIVRPNRHINIVFGLSAQGWSTDGNSNNYSYTSTDGSYSNSSHYDWRDCWRMSLQLGVGYTF